MQVIHKTRINAPGVTSVQLLVSARIIKVAYQEKVPYIWYAFNTDDEIHREVEVISVATGRPFQSENLTYIDTLFQTPYGLVWHVFYREI
jgi:hypothetical protein